jgi:menaquinone-9 beta-reductase
MRRKTISFQAGVDGIGFEVSTQPMKNPRDSFDVIIVGGGPAGSSAAIHLANRGARVLLAEQKKFPRSKLCGEFISPECLDHFGRLGVMDKIDAAEGAALNETVFYSRNGRNVSVPSKWFGVGQAAALGLSRAEMDSRLLARAREVGVEVRENSQATNLIYDGERVCGVKLRAGGGEILTERASVTFDATGRARALARRLEKKNQSSGLKSRRPSRFVAFKTHLSGARGASGNCEIYVYPGGYGGLNPIENDVSNLCFIASSSVVRKFGGDAQRMMIDVVSQNQRAKWTLGKARAVSPWLAVGLDGFGRRTLVPAKGLITIGDAASFIDPFTGSGMLMALESGELAAESVSFFLAGLQEDETFWDLAEDYRARYKEKFASRLRVSAGLRHAAFMPRFAEAMIFVVGASDGIRRRLARATRTRRDEMLIRER